MSQINIVSAFIELKQIEEIIKDCVYRCIFVKYKKNTKMVHDSEDDFKILYSTPLKSIDAVFERKILLNQAIYTSDAMTNVNLSGIIISKAKVLQYKKVLSLSESFIFDCRHNIDDFEKDIIDRTAFDNEIIKNIDSIVEESDRTTYITV